MIPPTFEYVRAGSIDEAVSLLGENGEDAKLLAGGHSLLPLMKLRLASPSVLIDIGRLSELSYVRESAGELQVGALTRYCDLVTSDVARTRAPLLAYAAGQVGDPQVRHRGTIGGSIVHGDPASDLPAVVLALGGTLVLRGPSGERVVPASEFFLGFLDTAVQPDEVLVEIRVPVAPGPYGFEKFNRRAQDWAIVGVAVAETADGIGVGLVNMHAAPMRAGAVEDALRAGAGAAEAAELATEGTDPPADLNASREYRAHLARVLTRRALEAVGR